MPVIFARVDERLVHGAVVQGWLPLTKTKEVLVVYSGAGELEKNLLRMALPPEYGLRVLPPQEAAAHIKENKDNIFLLARDLEDFKKLLSSGAGIKEVNIGGVYFKEGAKTLRPGFYLTEREKDILKELIAAGVKIDARGVPKDKDFDIKVVING